MQDTKLRVEIAIIIIVLGVIGVTTLVYYPLFRSNLNMKSNLLNLTFSNKLVRENAAKKTLEISATKGKYNYVEDISLKIENKGESTAYYYRGCSTFLPMIMKLDEKTKEWVNILDTIKEPIYVCETEPTIAVLSPSGEIVWKFESFNKLVQEALKELGEGRYRFGFEFSNIKKGQKLAREDIITVYSDTFDIQSSN